MAATNRAPASDRSWSGRRLRGGVIGPGRSRRDARDGSARCAAHPSRSRGSARTSRSPARCTGSRTAHSDSWRASSRRRAGRHGSCRCRSDSGSRRASFSPLASPSPRVRSALLSQDAAAGEEPAECRPERPLIGPDDRRPGDHQNIPARSQRREQRPDLHPESPPNAIPDDRRAEGPSGRQAEPRYPKLGPEDSCGEERVRSDRTSFLECREVLRAGEHHEPRPEAVPGSQADRRLRPRARRAARTRRPPVVLIRARKPCSLARWRFLGW